MKKLLQTLSTLFFVLVMCRPALAVSSVSELTSEAMAMQSSPVVTIGYLVQLLFSLLIVFGLIYLSAKYVLPKLQVGAKSRLIEVVDKVGLEPQASAYIIKVGKKSYLLGVSSKNISLITELEESDEA